MNDKTKGKLLITLVISIIALSCGTACGITNVIQLNHSTPYQDESQDTQEDVESSNIRQHTTVSQDSNMGVDDEDKTVKDDTKTINKTQNNTTINKNKTVDYTINNTTQPNYTEDANNSSLKNTEISNTEDEVVSNESNDEYFTNDSNLVTKLEKFTHEDANATY